MSLGIYPVFNPPTPAAKFEGLGEVLALQFDALDKLARTHGLTSLYAFADTREVPADFDGHPEDLEQIMGKWEDWFPCHDGRLAIEALARLITSDTAAAESLESPEAVAHELRGIAQALFVGETEGAQFRLEMS
jgi:hypothetical protein